MNLLMSQKDVIAALGTGELEPPGRVGANATAANCVIERGGHDKDGLPDGRRPQPAERQPGDPVREAPESDLG